MADTPMVVISFKDFPTGDEDLRDLTLDVRESLDKRCRLLAEEFPETTRFEITLTPDGVGYVAQAHVTGKSTEVTPHATATELRPAVDLLLDKLEKQLRRVHDKRIFTPRREAKLNHPRRGG